MKVKLEKIKNFPNNYKATLDSYERITRVNKSMNVLFVLQLSCNPPK